MSTRDRGAGYDADAIQAEQYACRSATARRLWQFRANARGIK